jgi:predicted Zn-dependent protease
MLSLKRIMSSELRIAILVCAITMAFPSESPAQAITYQSAVEALYNLDFSTAEQRFDTLIKQDDDNLEYWNGRASTILLKILYDQQKFNTESFTGSSIGTKRSKDDVNNLDERKLRNTVELVIQKANAVLARNRNDVRALYALGVANATLASFEGLARQSYLGAHSKAKAARNYHQQVLKLDPTFTDAKLSIGIYEYGVGTISSKWRFFLGVFGIRGDKPSGIRSIETVASQGKRATTDAKLILVVVYEREKRYDDALRLIDELLSRYPRNFQLEITKAAIYGKMKNWNRAIEVYQHIMSKVQARQDGYERLRPEKVYFEIGLGNVHRLHLDDAIAAFDHVVRGEKATSDEKASSHVWLGKIFDSRGERQKALQQYNAVLTLDCDPETKDEANRYRRTPFKG